MYPRRLRPKGSLANAMSARRSRSVARPNSAEPDESAEGSSEAGRKDKGKRRADSQTGGSTSIDHVPHSAAFPISTLLEEALNTPLPPVSLPSDLDSSFEPPSPISPPPQAHQASSLRFPGQPRLLSQLTRSTMPTAGLTYSAVDAARRGRAATHTGPQQYGESSTSTQHTLNTVPFPDLDPTTGLPIEPFNGPAHPVAPPLHLQRTITDLLAAPARPADIPSLKPYLPSLTLPRMSLPGLPSAAGIRSFSSSAPQEDWSSWATGWWSGNKGKIDRMMSEDDQAGTVEEATEKLRRKCASHWIGRWLIIDRTPKHPLVFCHGLLGFDYIGKIVGVLRALSLTSTGPGSLPA